MHPERLSNGPKSPSFQHKPKAGTYAINVFNTTKDTVTDTLGSLFGGARDVAEQTYQGWEATKEAVEPPEWLKKILRIHEDIGTGGDNGGPNGDKDPKQSKVGAGVAAGATAAGATAAAYGYEKSGENDPREVQEVARDDQMMVLTKKMIEIRSILQQVGQSESLTLPAIVVIGSQSSGKSSVLEAIVGHEFLPKGSNMVTRRPIELTLVNTPESKDEYGEFPDLGLRRITDFTSIQRTLTELNMAVPDTEAISDDPIHLTVYSPNVPDLSLIDLPGYIQVVGHNQPLELKQKITDLCDKYIQPPNVILAISAADVDLANSTALRASRRVDPRGERTIGVITKMDLVDPRRGASILNDKQYPLRLGYVGVVSKAPQSQGLFKMGSMDLLSTIVKQENAFFSSHPFEFGADAGVDVGTMTLRKKLMHTLEQTMSASLASTSDAIKQELEEATYEFKVQYNDRPLSAESYLAESLDAFKHNFKQFSEAFGRPQMQELLKEELDQKVENCIKPYKFDIDMDDREWAHGREHVQTVLKKELKDCESAMSNLEASAGGRKKLKEVMAFVDKARKGDIVVEGDGRSGAGGFSAALLTRGREAVFHRDRADILKMRLLAVKSKQCASLKNKYYCPEVFLDAAASKLAATAVLFLNVELLSEFYYNFPRELDLRLGRHLSDHEIERFAKEDPKIRQHLDVIRRKELLELVLDKMESLKQLESRERERRGSVSKTRGQKERGRWGLF
ncbi:uncharacterized protein J7T54_004018 [Emericellopsis cladophorae]|uniref:dynamin GTPase n=1 Tax=Emericellopsis cladophorae TaxID=2686198 RepID=A0A9P9Y190_9HYPO|nr:uncharacterized protein J7T54_004018 [Emericellopsis cladophorae]KAI6781245.1 hypothetical protein J7T54_004018 [Emericellopsis cladophorae]